MPILTLLTDFGTRDHFVAAVKGSLLKALPDLQLIDITHEVAPFNVAQAAYLIRNVYADFPPGSIHLIGVDIEFKPGRRHVAARLDDHFFLCSDNGVLTLLAQEARAEKIVEITAFPEYEKSIFPLRDRFTRVAAHLAKGGALEEIGRRIETLRDSKTLKPVAEARRIKGSILYIDRFGNAVTNITQTLIRKVGRGRKFNIQARNYSFNRIYSRYGEIEGFEHSLDQLSDGKKLALYNSSGFLELSIYRSNLDTVGGAATLFGLQYRDTVTVDFLKSGSRYNRTITI